ncbi:MAG TPA: glycosyltransferase family 39 protein, partial [Chloroflexota bacterium]|nr:glycosyltransferase family 39 protein [Chloroflexota bacterium]
QVDFLRSATAFIDSGQFPLSSGLTFAVGTTGAPVHHPPLVTWLLTIPALVSRDPAWVSAWVAAFDAVAAPIVYLTAKRISGSTSAGVTAGVLYALNPTAIVFGRMIWNVDFVPLFAAVGLWGLVDFLVRARPWPLALSLLAIGCAAELHPVNAVFLGLWLLVAVIGWRKLRPQPIAVGAVLLLATIAPYLYLQTKSGWSDVLNLLQYLGRPKVLDGAVLDQAGAIAGPTMFRRLLPPPGDVMTTFGYDPLTWLLIALAAAGLIAASRHRAGWAASAWLALPILGSLRHNGDIVPHYLLAILPALAVLQGLAVGELWRLVASRPRLIGECSLAALSAWLAVSYGLFQRGVARDVRQLEYGMPLRYSLAAADLVRSRTGTDPLYLATPFLWNRTVPSLAGRHEYHWYWDRQAFVFPHEAAWYLVQNGSFGHAFLSAHFGPPNAAVANDAGLAEFSLFRLPQDAPREVFSGPNFRPLDASIGNVVRMEGYLAGALSAGQPAQVLLLWRVLDAGRVPDHLSQFAHLVDASGHTVSMDPDLYDVREP